MKEYDLVELIRERPEYTREGVKVGDFGAVMSEKAIDGYWYVIFSEFHTALDIADIMVREEDLKVHEHMPKDRIPPKPENALEKALRMVSGEGYIPSGGVEGDLPEED